MQKFFALLMALSLLALAACTATGIASLGATQCFTVEDTLPAVDHVPAKVVLLLGQSNATGVAANAYLQEKAPAVYAEAAAGYDHVRINYVTENGGNSSQGRFVPVTMGQGASADYFGPELGMASLFSARYAGETVFILKYSWGGTILHNQWLDGHARRGELYTAAMAFCKTSLAYLTRVGYLPQVVAVCWMQGESDAVNAVMAKRYYKNTRALVGYLRADLSDYTVEDFMFVDAGIAEVTYWTHYDVVNAAKQRYADEDAHAVYFDTQAMGLTTLGEPEGAPDIAHYDAESAYLLGREFASHLG